MRNSRWSQIFEYALNESVDIDYRVRRMRMNISICHCATTDGVLGLHRGWMHGIAMEVVTESLCFESTILATEMGLHICDDMLYNVLDSSAHKAANACAREHVAACQKLTASLRSPMGAPQRFQHSALDIGGLKNIEDGENGTRADDYGKHRTLDFAGARLATLSTV